MSTGSKLTEEALRRLPKKITLKGIALSRIIYVNGKHLPVETSREHIKHSTSFDWSYTGSGPAQLAYGLLLCFLPPDQVAPLYQTLKMVCIAQLPNRTFYARVKLRSLVRAMLGQQKRKTGPSAFVQIIRSRRADRIVFGRDFDTSDPNNPLIRRDEL